ncbi:MAG: hypothetical protein ACX93Q_15215 [Roseovarius sp.]
MNEKVSRLIAECGGVESAAAAISESVGRVVHKGTLSKRLSECRGWHVDEIAGLEDALGSYPVSRFMVSRLDPKPGNFDAPLDHHASAVLSATGDAFHSILAAQQSDADQDRATAIAEIDEAIAALRRARTALEAE